MPPDDKIDINPGRLALAALAGIIQGSVVMAILVLIGWLFQPQLIALLDLVR